MASYFPPKKNTAFIMYVGLVDQSNTKLLKASPTIAAGDFKVSIDGGAFANLTTLPTVTPASGTAVKISLSSAEMNGDNIVVTCIDAAGAEWCDQFINLQTSTRQIDDLSYTTTFKKNTALTNFEFLMTDSTNHNPATGKTVSVTRSIDGAAFAAGTLGSVTEVANGIYKVDFGAGDLNGSVVTLRATATGCDDLTITFIVEP